jgi:predicted MFS family arabinose efflux permease
MAAIMLLFMGQFALFTYLRPFLETVTKVDVSTLSLMLLAVGLAGLIGTALVGPMLTTQLHRVLIGIPAGMALLAIALIAFGGETWGTAGLLAGWGLIATPAPVAWGTWLTRTLPEDADAGGGLMVATIQLAITLGASLGGVLFDISGYRSTFLAGAVLLGSAAVLAFKAGRAAAAAIPHPPRHAHASLGVEAFGSPVVDCTH